MDELEVDDLEEEEEEVFLMEVVLEPAATDVDWPDARRPMRALTPVGGGGSAGGAIKLVSGGGNRSSSSPSDGGNNASPSSWPSSNFSSPLLDTLLSEG